jgi:hypothetical protein
MHRHRAPVSRAILLFALSALSMSASVIDFDDIQNVTAFGNPRVVRGTLLGLGISGDYDGAAWPGVGNDFWGVVNSADFAFSTVGALSGTQAAWNWGGWLQGEILFQTPQFVSGAYFNAFQAGQDWTADSVQFRGYDALGNLLGTSSVLYLDKGSAPAWQWLSLGVDNVQRLEIVATQTTWLDNTLGWWAMDDLTVQSDPQGAPEPGTVFTVGFGVCLLSLPTLLSLMRDESRQRGKGRATPPGI